ncbi:SDR family NAD(P)-dependent oxidoreductase [Bradyrhizobium erythrophlei]|jgi:NAD(P)-dependent dehydrogenase (short-subunit alcohol dehydrogenase family)|uniref:NAD(P)-dependent dehydrogenase, short-chain alcohol dehydrogenase family n=1 Tax=Bradyrhizobium erythrophlei TaxID=1437360 RepID=A0A1M5NNC6_9BRAD|nr:SDR family oxidoreductase [Bradyrhizobium erythrophlei]SHG90997.1 NAD(P)-dependent dehydrogenase, short-chain alcohol dehydrogenase family [Bradyrhizobium erythrophlei]
MTDISLTAPTTPSFRLDGKKALVTGASRGIGFAAAAALAQAGAQVTLAARSDSDLKAACSAISNRGGSCAYVVLDVADSSAVTKEVGRLGPLDVLINSAGMNRPKNLLDVPDQDIDEVFALNIKAPFYLAREVAKGMVEANIRGSIINVSSAMGLVGSPRRTVYSASKHALEGMTKAFAWDVGKWGIRVNTIVPCFVETAFTAGFFKEPGFKDWVTSRIAFGRVAVPEDYMGAAVFLASDASTMMTGAALVVDGGWTAV